MNVFNYKMDDFVEILLLNCYSSKNSGDGLLVDLAIDKIKKDHGEDVNIKIVCSDVESFESKYDAYPNEYAHNKNFLNYLKILIKFFLYTLTGRYQSSLYSRLGHFDYVYSVGGGYMRFGNVFESIKTSIVHLTQIAWVVSENSYSHVLLPQSIGPLRFIPKSIIKKLIGNSFQTVYVRDDRSLNELSVIGVRAIRAKDMAANKLCLRMTEPDFVIPESNNDTCVLILRDLRRGNAFNQMFLKKIAAATNGFSNVIYAVQSAVGSNNDADFYKLNGISDYINVKDALIAHPGAVVISVRLHGAIESLLEGFRTIHLSYERKGFGAYEDLGIPEFVDNVYSFNESSLVEKIASIKCIEPKQFFEKILGY